MIGEALSRRWGDLRPSLVGKAGLNENKNKSFPSHSRPSTHPSSTFQVALKCLGEEIMPSSVSSSGFPLTLAYTIEARALLL